MKFPHNAAIEVDAAAMLLPNASGGRTQRVDKEGAVPIAATCAVA